MKLIRIVQLLLAAVLLFSGCAKQSALTETADTSASKTDTYIQEDHSFERNDYQIHMDCLYTEDQTAANDILLIHGVTYSSHEFDVDYQDYSLVRFLARNGYRVWRIDITGFGQSDPVEDGFLPDSEYAAEDIHAAIEQIVSITGNDKIDLLGWSWGTVTGSYCAIDHPEHIRKLVLYAPIVAGIGAYEVTEPFHTNSWAHAADDFQRDGTGAFDESITDPTLISVYCSNCWRYDELSSPNGGRKDLCVDSSEILFDTSLLTMPTLMIYGDRDPFLRFEAVEEASRHLPEHSKTVVIPGGAHVIMYEKPHYHQFQTELLSFLNE